MSGLLATVIRDFVNVSFNPTGPELFASQPAVLKVAQRFHRNRTKFALHDIVKGLPELSPSTVRSSCYSLVTKGYLAKISEKKATGANSGTAMYKLTDLGKAWKSKIEDEGAMA